jgi:hypothetical protein
MNEKMFNGSAMLLPGRAFNFLEKQDITGIIGL